MDIIVKSKNCDVPSRLKDETVEKVEHATRFFDRLRNIEVVFAEEQNPRIAQPALVELTARTKGHYIRAEAAAEDHRAAVDEVVAKFERQLARYKSRLVDRRRKRQPVAAAAGNGSSPQLGGAQEIDEGPSIVRTKRFELQPMLPEDAALQLELLGHEFYVFTNAMTGSCNVIYRRRDGDFGLIEAAG